MMHVQGRESRYVGNGAKWVEVFVDRKNRAAAEEMTCLRKKALQPVKPQAEAPNTPLSMRR